MENRNIDISIVIPIYNEEDNIPELYLRLKKVIDTDFKDFGYEIIFVDDGSQDKSFELIEGIHQGDGNVKIIQFSRNFGHHIAVTAGLDYARGDLIVTMDGDLQDQPEEIISLYNKLKEGHDVVYAERVNKKFNFGKRFLSSLFNIIIKKLIDEKIVINSTIFRIMTRPVAENMKQLRECNRYVIGMIGWVGFKHASQKVEHGKRCKGKSKYGFSKQFLLALDAIFSFSNRPLKMATLMGFFISTVTFIYGLYIFFSWLFYNKQIPGYASIILSVFFLGGIQLIILGIIGEYIGRIYIESKKRPLYIVKKKIW